MQPDSMIGRAIIQRSDVIHRAAHVGRRRPDSLAGVREFELANVESQRLPSHGARPEPSGKRVNSRHARIPVRPQRVVKMTFASSNPLSPAMQSVSTGMRRNEGGVSDEQKRRSLRGPNRDVRAATIRRSGQPTRASASRMRAFDQDLSFSASYMLVARVTRTEGTVSSA